MTKVLSVDHLVFSSPTAIMTTVMKTKSDHDLGMKNIGWHRVTPQTLNSTQLEIQPEEKGSYKR